MKNNFYKYSILRYKHSPFLGESINIGLLIYFSNTCNFSFSYSKNLSRIKYIYDNVPEKTIKEYLKQIDRKLQSIRVSDDLFHLIEIDDLSTFISKNILSKDSTVLQFTECKKYPQNDLQNDFVEQILLKKHLIDDIKPNLAQPKEPQLLQEFYGYLKGLDFEKINREKKRFFTDYTLKNETGNEFKFDYAWQNGTLNLVKPISFDLKESKSIAEKAYRNFGQFYDLQDEAQKNNLRYDLIVGKPSSKHLFREYDHALNLLSNINHAKVIVEDEIKQYSLKAINAITEDL